MLYLLLLCILCINQYCYLLMFFLSYVLIKAKTSQYKFMCAQVGRWLLQKGNFYMRGLAGKGGLRLVGSEYFDVGSGAACTVIFEMTCTWHKLRETYLQTFYVVGFYRYSLKKCPKFWSLLC